MSCVDNAPAHAVSGSNKLRESVLEKAAPSVMNEGRDILQNEHSRLLVADSVGGTLEQLPSGVIEASLQPSSREGLARRTSCVEGKRSIWQWPREHIVGNALYGNVVIATDKLPGVSPGVGGPSLNEA